MVVAAFPIAKLSVLLIKQISKPIANICKERAKNHPFFRTYVCMPPAQFYTWCEVKTKMWILNLGRPVNIPVLSQEMAIELGANLLGETVIFVIGAALLTFEYTRQSRKEAAKEEKRQEEVNHMTSTITDLYFTVQQQQTQLREIERIIISLGGSPLTTPAPEIKQPPTPPSVTPPPTVENPPPKAEEPHPKPEKQKTAQKPEKHCAASPPTPYPNNGVILRSLNYIQMDVFSSIFPRQPVLTTDSGDGRFSHKREMAFVSEALQNLEHSFKSLF